MSLHPLTNFELQKYYKNEPKFDGVYSRNNLPIIKYGAYVINRDEFKSTKIHEIALYINGNNESASYDATYFDSFGVEDTQKEIKKFIGNKNITTNIYRIQAYDLIICGYFCIGFIDLMLKGKSLLDYANLFSPNDYKTILKYFHELKR